MRKREETWLSPTFWFEQQWVGMVMPFPKTENTRRGADVGSGERIILVQDEGPEKVSKHAKEQVSTEIETADTNVGFVDFLCHIWTYDITEER